MASGKEAVHGIPAASLGGVDLVAIRSIDPVAADEIARLGRAMVAGTDSDADFLRLCQLLLRFGETAKAEALLLAQASETDEAGQLFRATFPARVAAFDAAIERFRAQYGVSWKQAPGCRMAQRVFLVGSASTATATDPVATMLRRNGCEVDVRENGEEGIVADVQVRGDTHAIPMVYRDGTWGIDLEHVGARWLIRDGAKGS